MLLKDVQALSVSHKGMSVKIIETLTSDHDDGGANSSLERDVLVLGATGKTVRG